MTEPSKAALSQQSDRERAQAVFDAHIKWGCVVAPNFVENIAAEFTAIRAEAVAAERERWGIGRVPRSEACRAIKEGDNPDGDVRDPNRCWRCGEMLHPGHYCRSGAEP